MSILGNLESTLGGTGAQAAAGGGVAALVISQIVSMIQNRPGGLGGLLQAFQQNGLGHLFQSWIGSGVNLPISTDQVRNTLGTDWVAKIAQATGLPAAQIEQQLSTLLPQVVDHISPGGQLPQGELGGLLATAAQHVLHG